ncbi:Vacuolar protein sorting-associated protein [Tolypocladium ophioglossoides CBS 100239]|uniref:Vacuolar protein sorting-associated protein n=1 Tax=Tolypocladium ophioglossoides (strain CBS 100239) TaxID=1163406 RepID=A0A0L0NEB2_TOLOC|nr:Vacuolar protein sorting-associated protein [Tolypocladium ophioglossoides CBS 100239]
MSLDVNDGFVAANSAAALDDDLPIFTVERVQLQFSIAADFVAAQVANNVIILALSNGRILRIDLNRPEDIDDIDLPKKTSEIGVIRRMFLDPTASHLLVCTALGENYYLHSQSKHPRPLGRLRGVSIESVAWNPSLPTASTREILLGASDGNIYEAFIETSNEFYKKEVKHLKNLHKLPDGPITGLWVDNLHGKPDLRRAVIATQSRIFHLVGRIGHGHDGGTGSVYTRLFESEQPVVHELPRTTSGAYSTMAVSPDPPETNPYAEDAPDRAYAWLSSQGIFHGKLLNVPADNSLGSRVFSESKMLGRAQITSPESSGRRKPSSESIDGLALTQWHIISLVGGRVVATNRLTGNMVSEHDVLGGGQRPIGFSVDIQKNTFWLFTTEEIYEIVVRDEDRNIWQIMMDKKQFEPALQHARTQTQKETVAAAYGDHLAKKGHWTEAATVYGRSNKPFEDIALSLIDNNQPDALRQFLLTKLATTKKSAIMQRIMVASWLVEVFMAKLNSLDDTIITQAELSENLNTAESKKLLESVRKEYQEFVKTYKNDLDRKTVYDVISSHGREAELLYFANAVNDYNYVLSYWVQRERWAEALNVLKKQTDAEVFYRYSSVLMTHVAQEMVEMLMRHADLKPRSLIPALLEYNRNFTGEAKAQNQATRYLNYAVFQLNSKDAAVHNTLVSIYASHPSKDESGLLSYLQAQGDEPRYDPDFALRLCIQHHRTLSCVHIYTSMGQYLQAVDLALSHNEIELAAVIADRPMSNPQLRKRLWLAVARKVISKSDGIKTAIEFLKRCDLLKIEDLIPFFPDFVVIDDFKEEICGALEDYSRNIDGLKKEMDESSQTATNIKMDIAALDHRYAIVEPGEKCYVCGLPLLSRQFFVFPCQHSFHSDCMGRKVLEQSGMSKSSRIKELQMQIHKGLVSGAKREAVVAELDSLVASACLLCSDFAIKRIDEPFITRNDNRDEWAL